MWRLPDGELVMAGDGHEDWVADCDFHPSYFILFHFISFHFIFQLLFDLIYHF
jgi:hypothetical protein